MLHAWRSARGRQVVQRTSRAGEGRTQFHGSVSASTARERVARIIELESVIQEVEARRIFRLETMVAGGMKDEVSVYNTLIALSDRMGELQLAAVAKEATLTQELEAGIAKLSLPTSKLAKSAENLAALSEPITSEARRAFLETYLLGVGQEYARLKEVREKSTELANEKSAAKEAAAIDEASTAATTDQDSTTQ